MNRKFKPLKLVNEGIISFLHNNIGVICYLILLCNNFWESVHNILLGHFTKIFLKEHAVGKWESPCQSDRRGELILNLTALLSRTANITLIFIIPRSTSPPMPCWVMDASKQQNLWKSMYCCSMKHRILD